MYASDGPYVRIGIEVLNSVNKGCHVTSSHVPPARKIIAEAFYDNQAGADPSRTSDYRENHQNKVFPELEKPLIKLLLKVPYIDQKVLDTISAKLTASFGGNFGEIGYRRSRYQ